MAVPPNEPPPRRTVTVAVALGERHEDAVERALALIPPPPVAPPLVVIGDRRQVDRSSPAARALLALAAASPVPPRMLPPPGRAGFRRGGEGWRSIAVGEHGGRFRRVAVPRAVAEAGSRWLATTLPGAGGGAGSRPIWAAAGYVGRRDWFLARLARAGSEPGVMADLAAAVSPALVVLSGTLGDRPLAVATIDLIAAELVWLTLAPGDPAEEEGAGPWEDATVQRATELELGIRLPRQLRLATPEDRTGRPSDALGPLLDHLRLRLGLPDPGSTAG